ncbi:MAG: HEPN domain-containing protein [Candidatus Poribacteria bacterium]|nr:HEPN domain-containing protein [Candidatus Poribacteria bacterium]
MTEEKKQELKQLLHEAIENLIVLYEHRPSRIPMDVYRRYLQERWMYYGVDFLSFSFSTSFWLVIVGENTESKLFDLINRNTKLINFIEEQLAPFFIRDLIRTGSYIIESGFADGARLFYPRSGSNQSHHILQRLLEIAIVRGIDEAVLAFDRSCCPEGVHGFFQYVALVEELKVETEIQVYEGVRFVPLPSLNTEKITSEVVQYLPSFPFRVFMDQADTFFGKTLLVIDLPGFSMFHKPPERLFEPGTQVVNLPFQIEEQDVKYRNYQEISAFIKSFLQALSLACNSSFEIYHTGWFLGDDKSLHAQHGTTLTQSPFLKRDPFRGFTEVEKSEIDEAKRLYEILDSSDSNIGGRLQIPINRWIKSKAERNPVDKMIDLGIAFEALYLPKDNIDQLAFQFRLRAAWHLGKDKTDRSTLIDEFKAIYTLRSKAVHNGVVPEKIKVRKGEKPIATPEFIPRAQDLCRQSIVKILEDGKFPDWNDLILGEESL